MRLLMLAAVGGAIGSGARHLVNIGFGRWLGVGFPWSTATINIIGSILMGVLVEALVYRFNGSLELRTFIATGILGGFTTFSAFSLDAVTLLQRGDVASAALYIGGSVMFSIVGLFVGLSLARAVFA
jgi:fluoride exporter